MDKYYFQLFLENPLLVENSSEYRDSVREIQLRAQS